MNSKPCKHCLEYMQKFEIKIVEYSISGNIIKKKIKNIHTTHVSKGFISFNNLQILLNGSQSNK